MTIYCLSMKAAAMQTQAAQNRAVILLPIRDAELTFIKVVVTFFSYKHKDERGDTRFMVQKKEHA